MGQKSGHCMGNVGLKLHLLPNGFSVFKVGKIAFSSIAFLLRPCFPERATQGQLCKRLKPQLKNPRDH